MTGFQLRLLLLPALAGGLVLGATGVAPAHDTPSAPAPKAAARPAKPLRAQLLGHVDPGGPAYSGDVVAHRGFAYLSSYRAGRAACPAAGVRIFSLANPRRPVRVGTFADAASNPAVAETWTEKTIVRRVRTPSFAGDLAVTSFQSCSAAAFRGFGLYDVTNPARPRELALVRLEPRGSHEIWLAAARNRAWVYTAIPNSELVSAPDYDPRTREASTPGDPDFRIYDVSNPRRPVRVGAWGAWRQLGVKPTEGRGDFLRGTFVHSVITNERATRAFLSYWDLGTVILDISKPSAPRYLGRTPRSDDEGDAHSAWLARGGRVLIETHENGFGRPFLYDISNPRRPRLLSRFGPVSPTARPNVYTTGVHDPKVIGNRAFFSWYSRGVLVADISRPRRPRLVARLVPRPSVDRERALCENPCTMTWGVFPTKSYVLAADMVSGLWVFRLR